MRIFALSDVHTDNPANMAWVRDLSMTSYTADALLLAGDVSDDLDTLKETLEILRTRFAHVFFVPGNHDLWVRRGEYPHSVAKFRQLLALCADLDVQTAPARVGDSVNGEGVWIVPLFSWYMKPEEGEKSLFWPKEGEDPTLAMWSDNYFTRWPPSVQRESAAVYFLRLNERHIKTYDAPVISFSHFLPRADLILPTEEEIKANDRPFIDPEPTFNFSRVAGCDILEEQIRRIGAAIHVYGHQHRNRHRQIEGIRYISHCLGYPREGEIGENNRPHDGPKLIWKIGVGAIRRAGE